MESADRLLTAGEPFGRASGAMIMVHGRGGSAAGILELRHEFPDTGFAYVAPQAAGHTWYPNSFLAPLESNEPALSSGLALLQDVLGRTAAAGLPLERTIVLGFSQGACLALEFAARNGRSLGGVVGLSGGLIGPPGTEWSYEGSLAGTPVFLGCSDMDPHIPIERVQETAAIFERLGASVTERIYPGLGHTINRDEIRNAIRMMEVIAARI
ncbi:MAG: dienelactone hydrolase family protein [Gemmatimonadota bacterium]|nr:MAG: dienelactone hydrolase family protein [Gemmatimonadota bacterium]